MWINSMFLMSAAFAGPVSMADALPLLGNWTEINGPGAARIEPCKQTPGRLCAIGLARPGKDKTATVDTGIVMSNISADGVGRWRGIYHDGKRQLPATLRLVTPRVIELKVCLLFLCQTAKYGRAT